jgi:protein required for attachment to host cells
MQLDAGLWVVVADEDKALVLENTGTARNPVLTVGRRVDTADLLNEAERAARAASHVGHFTTEPVDHHRLGGQILARAVVDHLEEQRLAGAFDRVVLVASPQVLGALRDAAGKGLQAVVVAEFPKTLTGHALPDVARLLVDHLADL